MDQHHNRVRKAERESAAVECFGHGQRDEQEPRHSAEQHQPPRRGVGSHSVGEPRVAAVHPEDDRQQYGNPQQVQ